MPATTNGLPVNLDAERNLLGSWMLSEEAQESSWDLVEEQDFSAPRHREMYRACSQAIKKYGRCDDTITMQFLDRKDRPELLEMVRGVPSPLNAPTYARIVKENSVRRLLIQGSKSLGAAAHTGDEYESQVENLVRLIHRSQPSEASPPRTAAELLANPPEEVDALTSPPLFVRRGTTVLASETKVGKTNLWLHIAWALTEGKPLFTFLKPLEPVSVLLVELDLTEATLHKRINILRDELDWSHEGLSRFNVWPTRFLQLDTKPGLAKLRQVIKTTVPRPELVIIDNYNAAISGDPDKTVESRRASHALRDLQEQMGVCFGLTYEMRKPPPGVKVKYSLHDLKGNNVVAYDADGVMMLRPTDESRRHLEVRFPAIRHGDDSEYPEDLVLDRKGLSFVAGRQEDERAMTILSVLRDHKEGGGAMTWRECAKTLKSAGVRYDSNQLSSYIQDVKGGML